MQAAVSRADRNRATTHDGGPPPDPPWLDRSRDYPFESHFVDIEGNQVHYIDEGAGPTLLLLHANPLWSFYFRNVVRDLRRSFRCVALDYPGYGLSRAAAGYGFRVEDHARIVECVVRRLDLTDVTLVVHDSGGPVGLRVAGDDPPRFRAFVLCDCFGWPLSEDPKVARMLRFVSGRLFTFLNTSFNLLVRVVVAGGIKGTKLSASEKAAYIGPFLDKRKRHVQSRIFRSYVDARGEAYMRRVKAGLSRLRDKPALILFGAGDPVTKMRFPEKFAMLLPRSRIVLIAGQDHFPHDGAGAEIARVVAEWHATTAPERA
jgi:haloalkane dehalogenase